MGHSWQPPKRPLLCHTKSSAQILLALWWLQSEHRRMPGLECERHQAPLLSLLHMCEQPALLLCRLSLAQFVTYNPELQVFTASLLRFSFQETGSIRVSLARCWSH